MGHFFIFDCNGDIVGNPKGYRTIRGAIREKERRNSPANRAIWAAYDAKKKEDFNHTLVASVHQLPGEL